MLALAFLAGCNEEQSGGSSLNDQAAALADGLGFSNGEFLPPTDLLPTPSPTPSMPLVEPSFPSISVGTISSRVDGAFEGWDGDTIVRLMDGSLWQQDEFYYTYTYRYMPEVTVVNSVMYVEGIDRGVRVMRLN